MEGRPDLRRAMVGAALAAGALIVAGGASGAVVHDAGDARARVTIRHAAAFAVSAPIRTLPPAGPLERNERFEEWEEDTHELPIPVPGRVEADTVVQRALGEGQAPSLGVSFDGIGSRPDQHLLPPDPNGEIGPNDYVQIVNLQMAVYSRTGQIKHGPVTLQSIFGPLGKQCGVAGVGDPVVNYDQLADRWILSQFGFLFNPSTGEPIGPYFECFAVSKTPDPSGQYYLYAFKTSDTKLPDYPKIGVWPDAYTMSAVEFDEGGGFPGMAALAFERAKMIAGDPNAAMIYRPLFQSEPNVWGMLPADLDGFRLPPDGTAAPFVGIDFDWFTIGPKPTLKLYRFKVDWADPAASAFTPAGTIDTAAYDAFFCPGLLFDPCIPQKSSFTKLDILSDRLMFRAAYRRFADHDALVVDHTVDAGGDHAGVRWYELRNVTTSPVMYQQGTFAPDTESRWMGSAAMDGNGNIGLGYSVSGSDLNPGIRYTARLAGDPLGQMTLGEGSIVEGGGAQTSPFSRWGDYSDLTVDPLDDCTFWYTTEYYKATSELSWATRVGSFVVPGCDATAPSAVARPARARANRPVRLVYLVEEGSGRTADVITVFRSNGKVLKKIQGDPGPVGTVSVTTKAPGKPGIYRWCVVAVDEKGNESPPGCATLKVS